MTLKLAMMKMALSSWWGGRSEYESGASLVDYALLLIAVVAIGALIFFGSSVHNTDVPHFSTPFTPPSLLPVRRG